MWSVDQISITLAGQLMHGIVLTMFVNNQGMRSIQAWQDFVPHAAGGHVVLAMDSVAVRADGAEVQRRYMMVIMISR
jgi:hypothetical protein